ncbi:MAG: hypothetical protein PWP34_292 [Desulfuromonadales bacterium]|jgi:hypothetical protein|nr:hypothetical protein [Desulfuromonadales bacterium]
MPNVIESIINIADHPDNFYRVQIAQYRKGNDEDADIIKEFDLARNDTTGLLLTIRSLNR